MIVLFTEGLVIFNFYKRRLSKNSRSWYFRYKLGVLKGKLRINFFKGKIEPSWEDEANKIGGRLIFQIERSQENCRTRLSGHSS